MVFTLSEESRNEPIFAGKGAAAESVSNAYEDNLDTAVALGWAYVDRLCFDTFCEELDAAPQDSRAALTRLARLYGLSRLEKGLPFLLASQTLNGSQASQLRYIVVSERGPTRQGKTASDGHEILHCNDSLNSCAQ